MWQREQWKQSDSHIASARAEVNQPAPSRLAYGNVERYLACIEYLLLEQLLSKQVNSSAILPYNGGCGICLIG